MLPAGLRARHRRTPAPYLDTCQPHPHVLASLHQRLPSSAAEVDGSEERLVHRRSSILSVNSLHRVRAEVGNRNSRGRAQDRYRRRSVVSEVLASAGAGEHLVSAMSAATRWLVCTGLAILSCTMIFLEVRTAGHNAWNDGRLAPVAAWLRGYPLYGPHGEVPLQDYMYGPVAAVIYAPAAALSSPIMAVRAGVAMAFVLCVLPVSFFLWRATGCLEAVLAATFVFLLYAFRTPVLRQAAFWLHVDAPALGLGMLACTFVIRRADAERWFCLAASATAGVLAAGSKQVMLPVLVALPTYLWLTAGQRAARRYVVAMAAVGTLALVAVALVFDLRAMWFATIVGPARHPYQQDGFMLSFANATVDVARRCAPALLLLAVTLWLRSRRSGRSSVGNIWLGPALVAIACLPISVLGRMKVGGSYNTMSYTLYFLLVAALAALITSGGGPEPAWTPTYFPRCRESGAGHRSGDRRRSRSRRTCATEQRRRSGKRSGGVRSAPPR